MSGEDVHSIVDVERAGAELARELDVVLGYLFGSTARGQADALSDVDFAVLLDRELSPEARLDVQLRLMGALAACSPREVQVVVLNEAPPLLAYQVAEESVLLHARSAADHADFVSLARRVYFDWKPWEEFHTAALVRELKEGGLSERGPRHRRALDVGDHSGSPLPEYISDLQELQGVTREEYRDNKLIRRAVERTLHVAIEACLDIGHHLIGTRRFRSPADSADVFAILGEEGVIPPELASRLIKTARFRNLLVHEYARLDDDAVYAIFTRQTPDFDAFARAIAAYLE